MNARSIVDRMLESDDPDMPRDAKAHLHGTHEPDTARLAQMLTREMLEKGWRGVRINQGEDAFGAKAYTLTAGYVDAKHRAKWLGAGCRVIPCARWDENILLSGRLISSLVAAGKRTGWRIIEPKIEAYGPNGEIDFDSLTDPEDDPGDWHVEIEFRAEPLPGFWSKFSQADSY